MSPLRFKIVIPQILQAGNIRNVLSEENLYVNINALIVVPHILLVGNIRNVLSPVRRIYLPTLRFKLLPHQILKSN